MPIPHTYLVDARELYDGGKEVVGGQVHHVLHQVPCPHEVVQHILPTMTVCIPVTVTVSSLATHDLLTEQRDWPAKKPLQMSCISEDKCWEAWDTTCGQKGKDITSLITWRREAQKEEAFNDCLWNGEKGALSIRLILELFQRQWLGNFGFFMIQDHFIIWSEKLKRSWTLTTSQYTMAHIVYFKTQRTVTENTKVTY